MLYEWPNQALPALPTICQFSPESISIVDGSFSIGAVSSGVLTANRAYLIPFHLEEPITITKLFCANGATASGNVDVGIYSSDFTKIISSGSTAQAGTNDLQVFDVTDTTIGPGDFYLAVALDNGTGTVFTQNLTVAIGRRSGLLQMASAFPLPATITPATISAGTCPLVGLRQGGTAI